MCMKLLFFSISFKLFISLICEVEYLLNMLSSYWESASCPFSLLYTSTDKIQYGYTP